MELATLEPVSGKSRYDQIDHDAGSSVLFLPQLGDLVGILERADRPS
jgi:hypothetical protein